MVCLFKYDFDVVIKELFFDILFIVLKMVWSVLFYYDVGYIWLCCLISDLVSEMNVG